MEILLLIIVFACVLMLHFYKKNLYTTSENFSYHTTYKNSPLVYPHRLCNKKTKQKLDKVTKILKHVPPSTECSAQMFDQNNDAVKKYIYDIIDNRPKAVCMPNKCKAEFSRIDVDKYRDQQIRFRDKLYATSANAVDTVDRINALGDKLHGPFGAGRRIYDVFSDLVAN